MEGGQYNITKLFCLSGTKQVNVRYRKISDSDSDHRTIVLQSQLLLLPHSPDQFAPKRLHGVSYPQTPCCDWLKQIPSCNLIEYFDSTNSLKVILLSGVVSSAHVSCGFHTMTFSTSWIPSNINCAISMVFGFSVSVLQVL